MNVDELVGQNIGKYQLTSVLGRGGMAIVYRGVHTKIDGKEMAIKVVLPELARDEVFRRRFLQEGQVLHSLRHENIVGFHDIDEVSIPGGERVLVMELELLRGAPLDTHLRSRGPLPANEAVRLIRDAARGIGFAHAKGVLHRDIKPANLFIDDTSSKVKVLDFGIAKVRSEAERENPGLTKTSGPPGTLAYMAPETFDAGGEPDARSDVYALGLTLAECLLGVHPYLADGAMITNELQWVQVHARRSIPALTGASDALLAILSDATNKDPARRPADANVLAERLDGVLSGTPNKVFTTLHRDGDPFSTRVNESSARSASRSTERGRGATQITVPSKSRVPVIVGVGAIGIVLAGGIWMSQQASSSAPGVPIGGTQHAGNAGDAGDAGAQPPPPTIACPIGWEQAAEECRPTGMIRIPDRLSASDGIAPFFMDTHEVTASAYAECVSHSPNGCTPAGTEPMCNAANRAGEGTHPVNCVTVEQARAYCEYRHARLPTDREWLVAARGSERRKYPWGDRPPTQRSRIQWLIVDAVPATAAVTTSLDDRTPEGIFDLAANVAEWVEISGLSDSDPGEHLGGAWNLMSPTVLSFESAPRGEPVGARLPTVGFRCAASVGDAPRPGPTAP